MKNASQKVNTDDIIFSCILLLNKSDSSRLGDSRFLGLEALCFFLTDENSFTGS